MLLLLQLLLQLLLMQRRGRVLTVIELISSIAAGMMRIVQNGRAHLIVAINRLRLLLLLLRLWLLLLQLL